MNDKIVDPNDVQIVARTFNKLLDESDQERRIFSKLLLTIYTPVTSGLFFLSTSLVLNNNREKISFLITVASGILIVFSALLENLGYFLISKSIAGVYVEHVKKTGKHLNNPMYGKEWQNKLAEMQVYIMVILLVVNLLSAMCFIYFKII